MHNLKPIQAALALAIGGMLCAPRICEGIIAYSWVDRGMYTSGEPIGYDLDFNGDMINDILFTSTGMWFGAFIQGDGQIISGGNDVHALAAGTSIGPDTPQGDWQQGYLGLLGLNSSAVVPPGVVLNTGEFRLTTAYMGVMFDIQEAVHYGWVRISNPFDGTGGTIMDFAYETQPGVGILAGAGAIPEPATSALLAIGGLLLALRRRKRIQASE